MISSVIRRTTLLAVAVTAATSLVSGAAVSAGPHATSLSIRAAHQAVKPGGSTVISGALRVGGGQALPGKTVTLEARLAGDTGFLPVGTDVTGPRGGVAIKVAPAESTRYRWVFAGDDADRASRSGVMLVKVRQPAHPPKRLRTSLSIRAAHARVALDGRDTISGRLLSRKKPLRGKIVVLLSRADGADSWSFAAARKTGAKGGVAFVVRPTTSSRYRLLFQGTTHLRKARSGVVHVATRPVAVSIAVSAPSVPSGTEATVSGVVTDNGVAYAGQKVQLWGRPAGSRQKFAALASADSGVDGGVGFSVTPTRSMTYFLYFPRTADKPAARSVARTIVVS